MSRCLEEAGLPPGVLNVVHGGRVVSLRDEDFESGSQQLGAALLPGQSNPTGSLRDVGYRGHGHMLPVSNTGDSLGG